MRDASLERAGGCLCGAVRYRLLSEPTDIGYCHCRMCQLASGAPTIVFASVSREDYQLDRGDPARRRSSAVGERWFCRDCGSTLAMVMSYCPDSIDFTVATLDELLDLPPTFHIWRESRIGWFDTLDALPRHERSRPQTMAEHPELATVEPIRA